MPTTVDPSELSLTPQGAGPVQVALSGPATGSLSAQPNASTVEAEVRRAAKEATLDPDHMANLARVESGFNPTADAHILHPDSHAYGPMQLEPSTAKELGVDPKNWKENIYGGVQYFRKLLNRFGGDYSKATLAYHDGASAIANGPPSTAALQYQHAVMGPKASPTAPGIDEADLSLTPPGTPPVQQQQDTPIGFWGNLVNSIKSQAPGEIAGAVGGPLARLAVDPEYRQTIKENLPALGAMGVSMLVPPLALAEAGLYGRLALNLAPKVIAAMGGGAAGGIAKEAMEGNVPKSSEDVANLINNYGIPQGVAEMLGGLPSTIYPATKFANRIYQGAFKPTADELKLGVNETLQEARIPTDPLKAQIKMNAINDAINEQTEAIMQQHNAGKTAAGGIGPAGQIPAQGAIPTTIDRQDVINRTIASAKEFASKGLRDPYAYLNEVKDELQLMQNSHPGQLDFDYARALKQDYRAGLKFNSPRTSDYTPQIRKMISTAIDDSMEAIEPRLTPLHNYQKKILDAMPAVERAAQREGGKGLFSANVGRPLAAAVIGGGSQLAYHDPMLSIALGLGGSQLGNPIRYGQLALALKNHPELIRQIMTFGPRMLSQPAQEENRQKLQQAVVPTVFNAPQQ